MKQWARPLDGTEQGSVLGDKTTGLQELWSLKGQFSVRKSSE